MSKFTKTSGFHKLRIFFYIFYDPQFRYLVYDETILVTLHHLRRCNVIVLSSARFSTSRDAL